MLEKLKHYLSDEEYNLGKMLEVIKTDKTKVVTCNWFDKDQWIEYNPEKDEYQYEDDCFLGSSNIDVIFYFRDQYNIGWSRTAKWFIMDKPK